MIRLLLLLVGLLVVGAMVVGWLKTYSLEHSDNQVAFLHGQANLVGFNGEYKGAAAGYLGNWQGKTIDQVAKSGSNRLLENGAIVARYPFTLSMGKGLRDRQLEVIKLDYNQVGNPWWLKLIVDEVVEVAPNQYLGKVHIHLMPGLTFTVAYFNLHK